MHGFAVPLAIYAGYGRISEDSVPDRYIGTGCVKGPHYIKRISQHLPGLVPIPFASDFLYVSSLIYHKRTMILPLA